MPSQRRASPYVRALRAASWASVLVVLSCAVWTPAIPVGDCFQPAPATETLRVANGAVRVPLEIGPLGANQRKDSPRINGELGGRDDGPAPGPRVGQPGAQTLEACPARRACAIDAIGDGGGSGCSSRSALRSTARRQQRRTDPKEAQLFSRSFDFSGPTGPQDS
jgi:hypothetical protein